MVLVTPGVLTTTTQQIQGRPVRQYCGIVSSDAVVVVHRNRHRVRDGNLHLHQGCRRALRALARLASARGATVVVGIEINYVAVGVGKLLVTATGTAVRLQPSNPSIMVAVVLPKSLSADWEKTVDTSGASLVISTTSQIEDRPVLEYLGIASGEAVMSSAPTNKRTPGAMRHSHSTATALEQRVRDTRCQAIEAMVQQANEVGATAIIAVGITYTTVQRPDEEQLIITASGTVVVL